MLALIDKGGTIAVLVIAVLALAWLVRWLLKLLLDGQNQAIAYREALVERRDTKLTQMRDLLTGQQALFDRALDMQQGLLERLSGELRRAPQ